MGQESVRRQIREVVKLKRTRDKAKLNKAIRRLRDDISHGKNTTPDMIEATEAFARTAELLGTIREVYGNPYASRGRLI